MTFMPEIYFAFLVMCFATAMFNTFLLYMIIKKLKTFDTLKEKKDTVVMTTDEKDDPPFLGEDGLYSYDNMVRRKTKEDRWLE